MRSGARDRLLRRRMRQGAEGTGALDDKGRWIDNVFIERLWRSVKYEDIYLHAYQTSREVKVALARYFGFYNVRRPHQSLEYRTPDEMYFGTQNLKEVA